MLHNVMKTPPWPF